MSCLRVSLFCLSPPSFSRNCRARVQTRTSTGEVAPSLKADHGVGRGGTTHPGSWTAAAQRFSIRLRWNDPRSIWTPTTRDGTGERGGRIADIRDSLFERVHKKGLSGPNMGKSIRPECVIQILSRSQKHEQVLKFPTHILSAQSGRVTTHKWFAAA